jgi:hypothetical protein
MGRRCEAGEEADLLKLPVPDISPKGKINQKPLKHTAPTRVPLLRGAQRLHIWLVPR